MTRMYAVQIAGVLPPSLARWFEDMAVTVSHAEGVDPCTIFAVPVQDQAALRGLLNRFWDLNLTIISVQRLNVPHREPIGDDDPQGVRSGRRIRRLP